MKFKHNLLVILTLLISLIILVSLWPTQILSAATELPQGELLHISHESGDLSEYTRYQGGVSVTQAAAMVGNYGMQVNYNNANSDWVEKSGINHTTNVLRFRFFVDMTNINQYDNTGFYFLRFNQDGSYPTGANTVVGMTYRYEIANGYSLRVITGLDDGIEDFHPQVWKPSELRGYIEILMVGESADGAADGTLQWWLNGVSQQIIGGIENYNIFQCVDEFRIGTVSGLEESSSGKMYVDDIIIRDDDLEIGASTRYDLELNKQLLMGGYSPGDQVDFSINYYNHGNISTTVTITDTLPGGLSFVGAWWQDGTPNAGDPLPAPTILGNQLIWELPELSVVNGVGFNLKLIINETLDAAIVPKNCATIASEGMDVYPGDNSACAPISITPPLGELVHITHESGDLSEYTSTNGSVSATQAAAIVGQYGMQADYDDTVKDWVEISGINHNTDTLRFRFYIDMSNIIQDDNVGVYFLRFDQDGSFPSGANTVIGMTYRHENANGYGVQPFSGTDNGIEDFHLRIWKPDPMNGYIEVLMVRESWDGAADGTFQWWFNGESQHIVGGLRNYNIFQYVDLFRIGLVNGLEASSSGVMYVDDIIIRDDDTEIGAAAMPFFSYLPMITR